jgi:nitrate/nitrite transporter NarK
VPYFLELSYGLGSGRAAAFSTVFELAGLPGIALAGWISDRYFDGKRGGISLIMRVGAVTATGSAAPCSRPRSAPPWSGATGAARASDVSPAALTAPAANARMRR